MERRKKLGAGLMLLCGALTLLPLVVTAVSMAFLPDTIPVHYGVEGTVDRWGSKYECFIFPVITFVMGGLLLLCSWLTPCVKAEGSEKAGRIALIAGIILLLAFNMLNGLILYTSWAMVEDLGEVPELGLRVLLLLAALLLVALGAAMPHLKRNHWIGVRTKWSLQSGAVWAKSQRFGGRAFAVAGLLSLLSLFLPSPWTALVFIASTAAAAVASLLYSQREGRKERGVS